jgi:hypothetical protein
MQLHVPSPIFSLHCVLRDTQTSSRHRRLVYQQFRALQSQISVLLRVFGRVLGQATWRFASVFDSQT